MTRRQLYRWFQCDAAKRRRKDGQQLAAKSNLAIAGLARDCARVLPRILPRIQVLRSAFADSSVILIENDSRDRTKKLLQNYSESQPGVIIDSRDTGVARSVPPFSRERIDRMADCRNRYLQIATTLDPQPDFLLVIDLDLHKISEVGIWDSLSMMNEWDAVTANGLALPGKGFRRAFAPYKYWDTYALRSVDMAEKPQTTLEIVENRERFSGLTPGEPSVAVASAFGGAAIYRWPLLKGLHYSSAENNDPEVRSLCEHAVFHHRLRQNHEARICINPAFLIFYETAWDVTLGRKARQVRRWFRKR